MTTFRNILLASAALVIGATGAIGQTTELIYNAYLPPFNVTRKAAIEGFIERIVAETGGSVKITVPDASLAPANRQYEMVTDGLADMAIVTLDSVAQMVALPQLADLPLNAPSAEAASYAQNAIYQSHFAAVNELPGVKVFAVFNIGPRQYMSLQEGDAGTLAGMAGVKVWAPAGLLTEVGLKLGMVPITSQYTEVFEYVSKKSVDALMMTPGSALGVKVLEFVKSMTVIPGGLGTTSFAVIMSQESWDALTPDQQAGFERAADGLAQRVGHAVDAQERAADPAMAAVKVQELGAEDLATLQAAVAPLYDDWKARAAAKGITDPQAVIDEYRAHFATMPALQ